MDRRKALKIAAGIIAGSGVGLFSLVQFTKPPKPGLAEPQNLKYIPAKEGWIYVPLDPELTAQRAYRYYNDGSCMYATILSVVSQLAEHIGEPYSSFPMHLFKYGHGGVGGYGSICGALNGAAAIVGMLIGEKSAQDKVIADLFRWYEITPLPHFTPEEATFEYTPSVSTSQSILCHASNTNWCEASGFKVSSDERKERCRRLTADVAFRLTLALNSMYAQDYVAGLQSNPEAASCMACHGDQGKLDNIAVKMDCNSCHTESLGHQIFSDVHYKLLKE